MTAQVEQQPLSQEQYKRQTATIIQISDILESTYVRQEGWEPNYIHTAFGEKITKINIMGVVVDPPIIIEDMNQFSCTIDDGTAKIQVRAFEKINVPHLEVGTPVLIIGKPREYNNTYYILPQIIKPITKAWLELRNKELEVLETKRVRKTISKQQGKENLSAENELRARMQGIDKPNANSVPNEDESYTQRVRDNLKKVPKEDFDFSSGHEALVKSKQTTHSVNSKSIQMPDSPGNDDESFDITIDDDLDNNVEDATPPLIKLIDELDKGDGVLLEEIALRVENADEKITKLLLHGEIYEIRPGRVKVLK
jgi:RPA family protein